MKSIALDESGDILIENNVINMVDGDELLRQKVHEVLQTNQGEWFFDWEQGIIFSNILGKGVTEEAVRTEIERGLRQVDEDLTISSFEMSISGRKLTVNFTAVNEDTNEEIKVSTEY